MSAAELPDFERAPVTNAAGLVIEVAAALVAIGAAPDDELTALGLPMLRMVLSGLGQSLALAATLIPEDAGQVTP